MPKGLQLDALTARSWLILRRKKGTMMSLTRALDVTSSAQWLSVVQKEPMLAMAATALERMKHTEGFAVPLPFFFGASTSGCCPPSRLSSFFLSLDLNALSEILYGPFLWPKLGSAPW